MLKHVSIGGTTAVVYWSHPKILNFNAMIKLLSGDVLLWIYYVMMQSSCLFLNLNAHFELLALPVSSTRHIARIFFGGRRGKGVGRLLGFRIDSFRGKKRQRKKWKVLTESQHLYGSTIILFSSAAHSSNKSSALARYIVYVFSQSHAKGKISTPFKRVALICFLL